MLITFLAIVATVCIAGLALLVLFEPGLAYRVVGREGPLDLTRSAALIGLLVDSEVHAASSASELKDGEEFYAAELQAIAAARHTVHIEAFIFHPSSIGLQFRTALTACARRGVRVRIIVDAIGSFGTRDSYFDVLRSAGGEVAWYQPIRWYTLKRFNNRTHRELIVVDGSTGFIGGAGIADHWSTPQAGGRPWRDTMVRVTGRVVAGLQTAFMENWLEATGEIVAGVDSFPDRQATDDGVPALVVVSAPSPARSSRARVLFQLLLAGARRSIDINSPYFLPDRSVRRELMAAAARGVRVRIVVPGKFNNHSLARRASRRKYGELLNAGIQIYEYRPGMIHAKIMVVDQCWSVVGSTNFDSRSFELNDEVNLALVDHDFASRLIMTFESDVESSQLITASEWRRRPLTERALAVIGAVLERQE